MGRGGIGGGSGGGRSSSSHSSSSRLVSGHRPSSGGFSSRGSGSRGGISSSRSSFSSSSRGSSFGGSRPPSPPPRRTPPPPPPHYGAPPPPPPRYGSSYNRSYRRAGYYGGTRSTYSSGSSAKAVVTVIVMILVLLFILVIARSCSSGGFDYSVTTHQGLGKTKMTPLAEFRTDCVVDEDNWFADSYQVGKDLKSFYDRTGIQPYVLIKSPDNSLTSDSAKDTFADNWYSEHIEHEGALLYVYFAETDPDTVGYSTLIGGSATKAFFDSAATDAFWNAYDSYYYNSSITEEQLIVNTFNDTAEICLSDKTVTNTRASGFAAFASKAVPVVVILVIVVIIAIVTMKLVKAKHKRDAEAAAETERILNTPLEHLSDEDDLVDKYNNGQ